MEMIITVGNIGSGKTTLSRERVKQNPDKHYHIIDVDSLVNMFYGDYAFNEQDYQIYADSKYALACVVLKAGKSVIIDGLNSTPRSRRRFTQLARRYNATIGCIDFGPGSLEDLERRQKENRGKPEAQWERVWERTYHTYVKPEYSEGFDFIERRYCELEDPNA